MDMDLFQHISKFTSCFRFHAAQNLPYPDHMQYDALKLSVMGCEEYQKCVSSFEKSHKTPESQNYAALCEELLTHHDHLLSTNALIARSAVYHANAAQQSQLPSNKPPPTTQNRRNTNNRNNRRPAAKRVDRSLEYEAPFTYCWTHGHGFHSSQECSYPNPGHQDHATADKPMGGTTFTAASRIKR
jgi:hypothetical protein